MLLLPFLKSSFSFLDHQASRFFNLDIGQHATWTLVAKNCGTLLGINLRLSLGRNIHYLSYGLSTFKLLLAFSFS